MAEVADEIVAEGAEIIWVLEKGPGFEDGTAEECMATMDVLGSPSVGWCVGDDETNPVAGTFDGSPFSIGRGFDMIVPRSTMEILWTSSHGSTSGNENLEGSDILAKVQEALSLL